LHAVCAIRDRAHRIAAPRSAGNSLKAQANAAEPRAGTDDAHVMGRLPLAESIANRRLFMLYYAVVFLIIALVAALLGFGGIAAGAASIAKILFVVFLIVAIVTFLLSLGRR
jgi:uncharacterized membrane protein YtjA (UPF0391 family)